MMGHTCKYTDTFPPRSSMARDILWSGHGNRKTMGGCLCAVLSKLLPQGCLRRLICFERLLAAWATQIIIRCQELDAWNRIKNMVENPPNKHAKFAVFIDQRVLYSKKESQNSTDSTIRMWWTWIWYDSFVTLSQSNVAMDNHTKNKNPNGRTIIIYNRWFSWIFQPCITVSGIDP